MEAIYQSFVTFDWWGLCVTICNLLITFLIVKKFLFGPINKMLEARETEVRELYATAEADRTAAEAMKRDYSASIAGAKEEAAQITANAAKRAAARSEEILADANRQASDMVRKAEESIELEKKKALNEIKDEIAGLSVMIASKVVEKEINEADHKRMIEDFINKVGE